MRTSQAVGQLLGCPGPAQLERKPACRSLLPALAWQLWAAVPVHCIALQQGTRLQRMPARSAAEACIKLQLLTPLLSFPLLSQI